MFFAIRDDDTCFFTKPDDLDKAYDFMDREGVVSLSTVPYTFPYHKDNNPYGVEAESKYYDIAMNTDLIDYLKANIAEEKYEIMLHGYTHEYKKIGDKWYPEMLWKDKNQIRKELSDGKKHLEDVLQCKIKTFVAPNNIITAKGITALEELGLNLSGTIWKKPDRRIDRFYLHNYLHRACYSLSHGYPYSGVYLYSNHKELYAHKLRDYDYVEKICYECWNKGYNFVLYTHYWELNNNPKQKELLQKIYNKALDIGFEMAPLSKCFA